MTLTFISSILVSSSINIYVTAALAAVWTLVDLHFFSLQYMPLLSAINSFRLMIFSCHAHHHDSCYLSSSSVLSSSFFLYSGVLIHFTPHLTLKFKLPLLYNHPTCFHHLILLICHWFVYLIGFFYLSCSFHFKLFDWLSLAFNLNM